VAHRARDQWRPTACLATSRTRNQSANAATIVSGIRFQTWHGMTSNGSGVNVRTNPHIVNRWRPHVGSPVSSEIEHQACYSTIDGLLTTPSTLQVDFSRHPKAAHEKTR
jgi:hypothetical protein